MKYTCMLRCASPRAESGLPATTCCGGMKLLKLMVDTLKQMLMKGGAEEVGSKCVRVPIMEVLLLPSGHRWPLDSGHGLNVKGQPLGSAGITGNLGCITMATLDSPYRSREGGVLHPLFWNDVLTHTHTNTYQVSLHLCWASEREMLPFAGFLFICTHLDKNNGQQVEKLLQNAVLPRRH